MFQAEVKRFMSQVTGDDQLALYVNGMCVGFSTADRAKQMQLARFVDVANRAIQKEEATR